MSTIDQKTRKESFSQRAFRFSLSIIWLVDTLPNTRSCWVIGDQLVRSATSIGANMIEAKSASSKKDYVNFYTHALKSANETIYWLELLREAKKAHQDRINPLIEEAGELARILAASIITMKLNQKSKIKS